VYVAEGVIWCVHTNKCRLAKRAKKQGWLKD